MSVPLDSDGFVRRECPTCERELKWPGRDHGASEDEDAGEREATSPGGYYCPYCAVQAPPSAWFTKAQIEQAQATVTSEIVQPELDKLRDALGTLGQTSGGLIKVEVTSSGSRAEAPLPLTETDDMLRVEFVCHPRSPVKVLEAWTGAVHCRLCGTPTGANS